MAKYSYPKLPSKICNIDMRRGYAPVTDRVYEVLGIKAKTIPKNMEGTFDVDGHKVTIFKSGAVPGKKSQARRSSVHRMYFNIDGALVPTGRVEQFCEGALRKAGITRLRRRVGEGMFSYKTAVAGLRRRKGRK
jgi:hypothetical protein